LRKHIKTDEDKETDGNSRKGIGNQLLVLHTGGGARGEGTGQEEEERKGPWLLLFVPRPLALPPPPPLPPHPIPPPPAGARWDHRFLGFFRFFRYGFDRFCLVLQWLCNENLKTI